MEIMKERVAAGLRNMKIKPDYFLAIDGSDWDESDSILGIPLLHTALLFDPVSDGEVPFIPLWKEPYTEKYIIERARFSDGYKEWL